MIRDEQIKQMVKKYATTEETLAAIEGAKWADENPSDETIMRVLNCIGYEERSWIQTVRENWDKCKED